jgi:hypothetical protein
MLWGGYMLEMPQKYIAKFFSKQDGFKLFLPFFSQKSRFQKIFC